MDRFSIYIFVVAAILGLLFVYPRWEEHTAWETTKILIANQLKSPSTASFGNQQMEDCFSGTRNFYSFNGWVDSQNAMGATIRTRVKCDVIKSDSGKWEVHQIEFSPW